VEEELSLDERKWNEKGGGWENAASMGGSEWRKRINEHDNSLKDEAKADDRTLVDPSNTDVRIRKARWRRRIACIRTAPPSQAARGQRLADISVEP